MGCRPHRAFEQLARKKARQHNRGVCPGRSEPEQNRKEPSCLAELLSVRGASVSAELNHEKLIHVGTVRSQCRRVFLDHHCTYVGEQWTSVYPSASINILN